MTQISSNILIKMQNHRKLHKRVEIEAKRNPQFFYKEKNIKSMVMEYQGINRMKQEPGGPHNKRKE